MASPSTFVHGDFSHYPFVVSVKEENHVDFIYQFVKGSDSINNTCKAIIGEPTFFPRYGPFVHTFIVNYYGRGITKCQYCPYLMDKREESIYDNNLCNYIDLEFHEAVYPIRVSIYEVFDPGYVTEIWAENSQLHNQWFLLWSGCAQIVPPRTSRIFSPPLQSCNFKTQRLKLKFMRRPRYIYCTYIDAVMLIGTTKLLLPKTPKQSLTGLLTSINQHISPLDIHNLTPNYENAHLDIFDLRKKLVECCIIRTDESNCYIEPPRCAPEFEKQPCGFSKLSDEIILMIFKKLDIRSLCRVSSTNKHFNSLTRDPSLFKGLNSKDTYAKNGNKKSTYPSCICDMIFYLSFRCKHFQQLNLSSSINISASHFIKLITICGKSLTHLRLNNCSFVDDTALRTISRTCKNLKVFYLASVVGNRSTFHSLISNKGFEYLRKLEFLEELNLSFTDISTNSLCRILRKNRRIQNLDLYSAYRLNSDAIAIQVGHSCPNLKIIRFNNSVNITSEGINAIAKCKNLRSLVCPRIDSTTVDQRILRKLFSSCKYLENVNLWSLQLDSSFDEALMLCKNLKQVYLWNVPSLAIFEQCPKLQMIHVKQHCNRYDSFFAQVTEKYPHVSICKHF